MFALARIDGQTPARIVLYTLSTCGWCKKTKELLKELGIGYDFVDVDQLEYKDSQIALEEIKKWNPSCSFPTIIVDESKCIVGFKENEIREIVEK